MERLPSPSNREYCKRGELEEVERPSSTVFGHTTHVWGRRRQLSPSIRVG